MSSRNDGNRQNKQKEAIRKAVIQRNRRAGRLNKAGVEYGAVEIPIISWQDVWKEISTKKDFEDQMKILNAFNKANTDFNAYVSVTVANPYQKEIEKRIEINNRRAELETVYAKKHSKNTKLFGGIEKGEGVILSDRVPDSYITPRNLDNLSKSGFQAYAESIYNRTNATASIQRWGGYRENYVKALGALRDQTEGNEFVYNKAGQIIEALKERSLTSFRKNYYQDVLGDIDYLQSDEMQKVQTIWEKLVDVDRMFKLGIISEAETELSFA